MAISYIHSIAWYGQRTRTRPNSSQIGKEAQTSQSISYPKRQDIPNRNSAESTAYEQLRVGASKRKVLPRFGSRRLEQLQRMQESSWLAGQCNEHTNQPSLLRERGRRMEERGEKRQLSCLQHASSAVFCWDFCKIPAIPPHHRRDCPLPRGGRNFTSLQYLFLPWFSKKRKKKKKNESPHQMHCF